MEKNQEIERLFNLFLKDHCTKEEVQLLLEYFNIEENEVVLKDLIKRELETSKNDKIGSEPGISLEMNEVFQRIKKSINKSGTDT